MFGMFGMDAAMYICRNLLGCYLYQNCFRDTVAKRQQTRLYMFDTFITLSLFALTLLSALLIGDVFVGL